MGIFFFALDTIHYDYPAHRSVCNRTVEPKTQHHCGDGTRIPVSFARWLGGGEQLWELRAWLFVAIHFVAHSTKMPSYAL